MKHWSFEAHEMSKVGRPSKINKKVDLPKSLSFPQSIQELAAQVIIIEFLSFLLGNSL